MTETKTKAPAAEIADADLDKVRGGIASVAGGSPDGLIARRKTSDVASTAGGTPDGVASTASGNPKG